MLFLGALTGDVNAKDRRPEPAESAPVKAAADAARRTAVACAATPDAQPVMAQTVALRRPVDPAVVRALRQAVATVQADPCLLLAIAWQESRFDKLARNRHSSARGLLQFTTDTWLTVVRDFGAQHGLGTLAAAIRTSRDGRLSVTTPQLRRRILALRDDPALEAVMAAERLSQEQTILASELGRPITPTDLYVLHLLGPAGARKFLTELARTPGRLSVDVVGPAAKPNWSLFHRDGRYLSLHETYTRISLVLTEEAALHAAIFASAG